MVFRDEVAIYLLCLQNLHLQEEVRDYKSIFKKKRSLNSSSVLKNIKTLGTKKAK